MKTQTSSLLGALVLVLAACGSETQAGQGNQIRHMVIPPGAIVGYMAKPQTTHSCPKWKWSEASDTAPSIWMRKMSGTSTLPAGAVVGWAGANGCLPQGWEVATAGIPLSWYKSVAASTNGLIFEGMLIKLPEGTTATNWEMANENEVPKGYVERSVNW